MRSTVSDSSGIPENGANPEVGAERYGQLPVREWAAPEHGREAVARADAPPSATGAEVPDPGEPVGAGAGTGAAAGGYDWSVSGAARGGGPVASSAPDSVVDLVLDLMPGEGDRGAAFGATSASVSVSGTAPQPARPAAEAVAEAAVRTGGVDLLPAPTAERHAVESAPEDEDGVPDRASDAQAGAADVAPQAEADVTTAAAPTAYATTAYATTAAAPEVLAASAALDVEPAAREAEPAPGPAPEIAHASVPGPPPESAREALAEEPEDGLFLPGPDDDAPGTGHGFVPGPGPGGALAPVRREAGPSLSLSFGGADTGEPRTEVRVDTGRHHSVIANERTASIPVHLLFRDDPEDATDAAALPAAVVRRDADDERTAGFRRPPVPRSPQVRPSTRPAPVGDPRLHERPGPALPGWAALLAGLGGIAAAGGVLWWAGALPAGALSRIGLGPRPYDGIGLGVWAALALLLTVVLFALGGLTRGRVGYAWVLTLFGRYRGSVRRTGLMWVSPLLLRRRVDVRLRHWRSEPLPAMDANGTALRVVVLVVWRVKDTVRAALGVADHEEYLREQVEAAMARVLSQLPADAFHEDAHTLRNAEAVGDALTRMLMADCEPVGIEVYSAQPTGIEYAPEVAAAMQRRRIAAIDAKHRDSVLTSVVDAVDDTVNRLTARGLVELDDYERKSLVKDLTVAFYTGRGGGDSA
ncbi:SPFH domain-containing protein [Streptomyces sp. NPDC058382]|uniref:SPFH domain-containing protein n=1 Tax=unclassified Streptomyces TaxID=2593676 RepID=UPI0036394E05